MEKGENGPPKAVKYYTPTELLTDLTAALQSLYAGMQGVVDNYTSRVAEVAKKHGITQEEALRQASVVGGETLMKFLGLPTPGDKPKEKGAEGLEGEV